MHETTRCKIKGTLSEENAKQQSFAAAE